MAQVITIPFVHGAEQASDPRLTELTREGVIKSLVGFRYAKDGVLRSRAGFEAASRLGLWPGGSSEETVFRQLFRLGDSTCALVERTPGSYTFPREIVTQVLSSGAWVSSHHNSTDPRNDNAPTLQIFENIKDGVVGSGRRPVCLVSGQRAFVLTNDNTTVDVSMYSLSPLNASARMEFLGSVRIVPPGAPGTAVLVTAAITTRSSSFSADSPGLAVFIAIPGGDIRLYSVYLDSDGLVVSFLDDSVRQLTDVGTASMVATSFPTLDAPTVTGLDVHLVVGDGTTTTAQVYKVEKISYTSGPVIAHAAVGKLTRLSSVNQAGTNAVVVAGVDSSNDIVAVKFLAEFSSGTALFLASFSTPQPAPVVVLGSGTGTAIVAVHRSLIGVNGSIIAARIDSATMTITWSTLAYGTVIPADPAGSPGFIVQGASPGSLDVVRVPVVTNPDPGPSGNEPRFAIIEMGPGIGPKIVFSVDPFSAINSFDGEGAPRSFYSKQSNNSISLIARTTADDRNGSQLTVTLIKESTTEHVSVVEADGGLVIAGGIPSYYDGSSLHELGWVSRPVINSATLGAGGLSSGNYLTQLLWTALDSRGRVHRSGPSLIAAWTGGSSHSRIIQNTFPFTTREGARTEYYRTVANGSVLILDEVGISGATLDDSDVELVGAPTFESQQNKRVMYVGTETTTEVGAPEPFRFCVWAGNRLWSAGLLDPRKIQVSKELEVGVALEHAGPGAATFPNFFLQIPDECTALGELDEVVVLFSRRSIYVVSGIGPDRNGIGSFNTPQRLPATDGCDNQASLVHTPLGLVFQSTSFRIMLLPRGGGAPIWIGENFRDVFDRKRVRCSTYRPSTQEVLLAVPDALGVDVVASYDLRNNQWSSWEQENVVSMLEERSGLLLCVLSNGSLVRESVSTATSIGTKKIGLKNLALSRALGWSHVYRVGFLLTYQDTGGNVILRASYNGGPMTVVETRALPTVAIGTRVPMIFTLPNDKASTLELELELSAPSGRVADVHELVVEGEAEEGLSLEGSIAYG